MSSEAVFIVETGNSMSHTSTIEEVYTDEEAAERHRRSLIYQGRASGRNDFVSVRKREPKEECTEEPPDFEYRVFYENQITPEDTGETDWLPNYEKAYDVMEGLLEEKTAVRLRVRRRGKHGDVEQSRDSNRSPWENSWRDVDGESEPF